MPWDVLGTVTSRIVNEVKHVNRVFYDMHRQAAGHDRVGITDKTRKALKTLGS